MEMITRINKQAVYLLVPLAVITVFFTGWRFSLSILIGGLIGIGNLKGLVWSVKGLLGAEKAQSKMIALSIFKILFVFSLLLILAILKVLQVYGLLVGFTVVFLLIIKEGLLKAKTEDQDSSGTI